MKKFLTVFLLISALSITLLTCTETNTPQFNPHTDLISLHYDHAPDKDDGQSAAADRTILQTMFGKEWIKNHVVAVSGAYGKNAADFNVNSDAVMDSAWNDCGGWLDAHTNRGEVISQLAGCWSDVLKAGGDIWVKEGGQSDFTTAVIKYIRKQFSDIKTEKYIHVVQHSDWNENQTTESALDYVKKNSDYIRIRDANAYLNIKGGDETFVKAALDHPDFNPVWKAAFNYYDPKERLDFSDSGELMYILGLGEIGIDAFRQRFLNSGDIRVTGKTD